MQMYPKQLTTKATKKVNILINALKGMHKSDKSVIPNMAKNEDGSLKLT